MLNKPEFPPMNENAFAGIAGVDIGFGETKGANNIHSMVIPSVVGAAPTTRYSDEWSRDDGDIVYDDDGTWFIGQRALQHSKNIRYIKDRSRTTLPDYRRLVHVAFGRLHPHNSETEIAHISVATGLPVRHMGDGPQLKSMLEGQHRVHTKFSNGVYSVDNVAVMPQPYGTLFYNTLDDYGQLVNDDLSIGKITIIDIGRFTTNVVTVEDMAFSERASDSIDSGMYVVEDHLMRYLEAQYNWSDPRPDIIRRTIEDPLHQIFIDGELIDVSDAVNEGCSNLSELALGLVSELVGAARDIKAIIITGGGGIILKDWIKERYKRAYLTDEPIMANAIGFSRYGRRKWAR